MDYVRKNKHLLCCVYDSMGMEEMKRFFYTDFIDIVYTVINNTEKQLGLQIDPTFKQFVANFYTGAIASLIIDEFTDREGHDTQKAVEYLSLI